MRIGTSNMFTWNAGLSQSEVIRRGIERLVWAEKMGFDSAWITEHHFGNDPDYSPFGLDGKDFLAYDLTADPLTVLSHAAAKTSKIRLGTGVIVLHYDNPLRVAERAALVDIMSNGRLELGVGRGGGYREPTTFHVPQEGNRERFGEAIQIIQKAWTGQPFSFEGKHFQVPEVIVTPKPVQDPIPMYIAASNAESFAWVGKQRMPFCFAGGAWGRPGWEKYTVGTQAYFQSAADAGADTSNFLYPQVVFAYCADTDKEAEEVTRHHVEQYQRMIEAHYERQRHAIAGQGSTPPGAAADPKQTFDALAADIIESDIIGSPETCIRKLAAYRAHFKPNYLLLSVGFGDIPHDKVMRSMEMLSRYVLPAVANERELVGTA